MSFNIGRCNTGSTCSSQFVAIEIHPRSVRIVAKTRLFHSSKIIFGVSIRCRSKRVNFNRYVNHVPNFVLFLMEVLRAVSRREDRTPCVSLRSCRAFKEVSLRPQNSPTAIPAVERILKRAPHATFSFYPLLNHTRTT